MKDAGYQYVVIDDCWQVRRDAPGDIVGRRRSASRPGMKALADYVHAKGLKFGIYSDAGAQDLRADVRAATATSTRTRAQYAAWGVDYLKYDWCSTEGSTRASRLHA